MMSNTFHRRPIKNNLENHLLTKVARKVYSGILLVGLTVIFLIPTAASYAQEPSSLTRTLAEKKLELITADNLLQQGIDKSKSGNLRGAISDFNQAVIIDPELAEAYSHRGKAWRRLENSQQFQNARLEGLRVRGLARLQLGYLRGAIADFSEIIKYNPDSASAYVHRGLARLELGDNQRAVADFTAAIKIKSDLADVYRYRSLARQQLGDNQGARADWQKAAIF